MAYAMTSDGAPNSDRCEPDGAKLTDAAAADTTRQETEPWEDVRFASSPAETAAAPSCPSPSPKPPSDTGRVRPLESGERIDDFEIVRVLGRGAIADVYLARQVSLDRQVALKVAPDRGSEGRTMARLEHDYIVQVFSESVEASAGCRLLCMQLVPGTSLADIIRQLHGLDSREWTGADLLEIVDRQATLSESLDPAALRDRTQLAEMDGGRCNGMARRANGRGTRLCAWTRCFASRHQAGQYPGESIRAAHVGRFQYFFPLV
jgi:hypothetical protein